MWSRNAMINLGCLVGLVAVLGQHWPFAHGMCQKFAFFIDKDVVPDHTLEGHVFKTSTVGRATQCHMMCKDDCRCISMNFIQNIDQDNCELNDVNKEMKPAALKYKPGTSYYDLIREYTTDHGKSFIQGQDRCINRCCHPDPCFNGGTCEEICDPTAVRFNCTCPDYYTGQRCGKIKQPRSCKDLVTNGAKTSGTYNVYDSQKNPFQVYCDLDADVDFVWTLVESFSLGNINQFNTKRFVDDYPVNEDDVTINWQSYRLSLSRMQSIVDVSTHLRATCNFPDDGLVYTDYARAQLEGHDLFGTWASKCRMYELVNIRGIECRDCTAITNQREDKMWHINSYASASRGCDFDGTAGSVASEMNFGGYKHINPAFRCTSTPDSTTQHWIGSQLSN